MVGKESMPPSARRLFLLLLFCSVPVYQVPVVVRRCTGRRQKTIALLHGGTPAGLPQGQAWLQIHRSLDLLDRGEPCSLPSWAWGGPRWRLRGFWTSLALSHCCSTFLRPRPWTLVAWRSVQSNLPLWRLNSHKSLFSCCLHTTWDRALTTTQVIVSFLETALFHVVPEHGHMFPLTPTVPRCRKLKLSSHLAKMMD